MIKYVYCLFILQVIVQINARKLSCEFDRHHDVCWIRDLHINSTTFINYEPNRIRHPIKVIFTRSHIYQFPSALFDFYPTITSVTMNFALLTDIGRHHFVVAQQLTKLDLSHNNLTALNAESLEGAINLLELDLSYNRISFIHSNALLPIRSLFNLDLSFNDFVHFNVEVLQTVYLRNSLKYIHLNNNKINSMNLTKTPLHNIKMINLSNNRLTSIILLYTSVRQIHVENNHLINIEVLNTTTDNLKVFNCIRNNLTKINFLSNMKELTYLDLSDNFINDFTPINQLKNIKILLLRNCGFKISDFPIFNGLHSILNLDLSENYLNHLDLQFISSEDVVKFEIENNNFTEIIYTKIIEKFTNLRSISFFRSNLKLNFNCTYLQTIVDFFEMNSVKVGSDHNFLEYKKYNLTSIQGILCLNGTSYADINIIRNEFFKDENQLDVVKIDENLNEEFTSEECVPIEKSEYFKNSLFWMLFVILISFLLFKLFDVLYNKQEYFKFFVRFRTSPRTDVNLLCNEY